MPELGELGHEFFKFVDDIPRLQDLYRSSIIRALGTRLVPDLIECKPATCQVQPEALAMRVPARPAAMQSELWSGTRSSARQRQLPTEMSWQLFGADSMKRTQLLALVSLKCSTNSASFASIIAQPASMAPSSSLKVRGAP